MTNTKGLMYPALHKFYSALSSLEKFEKGKNFFDNISHLDNFFSEYRNITFVLQKSLKHTDFNHTYEELRDRYLVNDVCKWFIDKRNEVLKQQPFDLEKKISITLYLENSFPLSELTFTVENDVEYSTIIESLKYTFLEIGSVEVMFSAEFSFYERGKDRELYEDFVAGINNMKSFLNSMKKAIGEQCQLSDQLLGMIDELKFYRVPKNMLFIDDYVYYAKKNQFEKGSRVEMFTQPRSNRVPITNMSNMFPEGSLEDLFNNFMTLHLVIFQMQKRMMPTCLIVYSDDTFELMSFDSSIKTTTYRKFNEIAKRIEKDGIIKLLYVTEMLAYSLGQANPEELLKLSSKERATYKKSELLAFFMMNKDLSFSSHYFESDRINDMAYVASVMANSSSQATDVKLFKPVVKEFERINKSVV